jgi:anti-anti-sigma factor
MSDGGGRLPDGGRKPPPFVYRLDESLRDATILRLEGDIDSSTAPALEDALARAAARGGHVILDLEGVRYIDASAYHVLARARECARPGQRFILAGLAPPIRDLVNTLGLRRVADIHPSVDDAKRSLKIL